MAFRDHPEWRLRSQEFGPGQGTRSVIQGCQVARWEAPHPDQHAAGAAQPEIGAPNLWPSAADRDAARHGPGLAEALAPGFLSEGGFEAWKGDEEDCVFGG